MTGDCDLCGGTGWITYVDHKDDSWDVACPAGCPTVVQPLDDSADVPF